MQRKTNRIADNEQRKKREQSCGSTPQKPDHLPTRADSQARVWFRRSCSSQSLVHASDQDRGEQKQRKNRRR
uniref:Uncharacterized protein n=1 Tax=Oryza meridionalis TaxID=40149 RepID=A0A0E0E5T4_9ORYZ